MIEALLGIVAAVALIVGGVLGTMWGERRGRGKGRKEERAAQQRRAQETEGRIHDAIEDYARSPDAERARRLRDAAGRQ